MYGDGGTEGVFSMTGLRAEIWHATRAIRRVCYGYTAMAILAGMTGSNIVLYACIFWARGVKLDD